MIVSAGLSPAWQRILVFDRVQAGEVNRAIATTQCASGKVLNVARAASALGGTCRAVTIIGGGTGDAIEAEFTTDAIGARWTRSTQATRTCTTLVESSSGLVTELVENCAPLSDSEIAAFLDAARDEARAADLLVLTGSLPPGAPPDIYRQLMQHSSAGAIIDARGAELRECLAARPLLVKPNRSELEQTLGREAADERSLTDAMRELNRLGSRWVLVTDGPRAAWLSSDRELHRLAPPSLPRVVNPIGSGDCLAAGIAVALARGESMPEAVTFGIAAATANAAELLPARMSLDSVVLGRQAVRIRNCSDV